RAGTTPHRVTPRPAVILPLPEPAMQTRRRLPALLLVAVLGGCLADSEPLTPVAGSLNPALLPTAAADQHLVSFRGKGIPAKFAGEVGRLGVTVLHTPSGVGLGLVTGRDAAGAARLRSTTGVADVQVDEFIDLNTLRQAPVATADAHGHVN